MVKLFEIISRNKKTLVLILGIGLFLSLIPLQFAQAIGWGDLLGGIENLLTYFVTFPLKIAGLTLAISLFFLGIISGFLFFIAAGVLKWVITICLTIPITDITEGVVGVGWTFTQGFANMFLILILVFIGLATILKLREYEAKKTLPLLILIALLINFSPVLVGFIVDITNIITNFFFASINNIGGFSVEGFKSVFTEAWSPLETMLKSFIEFEDFIGTIGKIGTVIIYGIILTLFYGFAAVVFFFVGILLIARILFLWILMILAPIAFLSYIFPATRKLYMIGWNDWWKHLLSWAIIGIPIGFFLFLSTWIMKYQNVINEPFQKGALSTALADPNLSMGEIVIQEFSAVISNMLAPFVAIVLLWLGTKFAKKLAPEAALQIIEGVKKGAKIVAMSAVAAATMGVGAAGMAGLMGKAAVGARRMEAFVGRTPKVGGFLKSYVGKPISWATRGIEMVAKPPLEKYAARVRKEDVGAVMKGVEGDIEGQITRVESATTDAQRIQRLAWMKKEGTLQKAPQVWDRAASLVKKFADNPHFQKEANDVANVIPDKMIDEETKIKLEPTKKLQADMKKEIEEKAKDLSVEVEMKPVIDEEAAKLLKEKIVKTAQEAQDLAARNVAARYVHFTELKSGDMKDVAESSIKSTIATRALRDTTPQHLQAIVNNFKSKTSNEVIKKTFENMFTGKTDEENREILEKYYSSDPRHTRMIHWSLTTPAGREMNLPFRKYMRDPNNQPTTNLDVFEKRMGIQKELEKEPALKSFNKLHIAAEGYEQRIEELQRRGQPTATWENKFADAGARLTSMWEQIERDNQLRRKWEEIEKLRRPPQRRRGRRR